MRTVKAVVFTPMPSASVASANTVNPGLLARWRRARFTAALAYGLNRVPPEGGAGAARAGRAGLGPGRGGCHADTKKGFGFAKAQAGDWASLPMKTHRKELWFEVPARRQLINITGEVEEALRESGIREGLCLVDATHI